MAKSTSYSQFNNSTYGSDPFKDPEDSRDLTKFKQPDEGARVSYIENNGLPQIIFSPEAHDTMVEFVDLVKAEIGWLGTIEELGDRTYYIPEIFLLDQSVTASTTDLDQEAIMELSRELIDAGREEDVGKLLFWGHSHNTMDVCPSGTDDNTAKDVFGENSPYCLRGIFNRKGDARLDFFDFESDIVFKRLGFEVRDLGRQERLRSEIQDEIDEKVDHSLSTTTRTKSSGSGSKKTRYRRNKTSKKGKSGHPTYGNLRNRQTSTSQVGRQNTSTATKIDDEDSRSQLIQADFTSLDTKELPIEDVYDYIDIYEQLYDTPVSELPEEYDLPQVITSWAEELNSPVTLDDIYQAKHRASNIMVPPVGDYDGNDVDSMRFDHVVDTESALDFMRDHGRPPILWSELYN